MATTGQGSATERRGSCAARIPFLGCGWCPAKGLVGLLEDVEGDSFGVLLVHTLSVARASWPHRGHNLATVTGNSSDVPLCLLPARTWFGPLTCTAKLQCRFSASDVGARRVIVDSCARGFRTLLPGRPVQGRPVRRLVRDRCPDHQDLLQAQLSRPAPVRPQRALLPDRGGRPAGWLSGLQALPPGRLPGLPRMECARRRGRPGDAPDRRRHRRPGGGARASPPALGYTTRQLERLLQAEVGATRWPWPAPSGRRPRAS